MAEARSNLVHLEVTPYYHCVSKCVRQAFLSGEDKLTGKNYSHRRLWIESRLGLLSDVSAVDVYAYAVMSNHLNLVFHVDSARAKAWSDEEVVSRYGRLFRMMEAKYKEAPKALRSELVVTWRERLGSLSWVMRYLNESIARKANKEDGCKGRFWERRYLCQPLLDEEAVLTCMTYVDLGPMRAGNAQRLEQSESTSIYARLAKAAAVMDEVDGGAASKRRVTGVVAREACQLDRTNRKKLVPDGLAPFSDQAPKRDSQQDRDELRARPIPTTFMNYMDLLEWTGRAIRHNKTTHGSEPELLARLNVNPDAWLEAMAGTELARTRVLGSVERVREFSERRGLKRAHGVGFAQRMRRYD